MCTYPKICPLALLLFILCPGFPNSWGQASPNSESLGEIARELRTDKKDKDQLEATSQSLPNPAKQPVQVISDTPAVQQFMDQAKRLLMRENFAELDKMADVVRTSKSRFPGGGWKLSRFYEAVGNTEYLETEADWQNHLDLLQRWTVVRPQSITARVALADAYVGWAWAARGNGYGNTVTDQGWRLFEQRISQAQKVLADSATLPVNCPYWYELTQRVAQASGADKSQQRAIFESAVEFEPLYFAYYQIYATGLLPKWGGEPGDMETFAEETYRTLGGKEGAHIYFEIASNLCGRCGDSSPSGFSWPKLQEGFAALEELYGLTPLKLNRFAFLAATYGDKAVAAKAFQRIGPNWDPDVWGSRARFESQRIWAGLPASLPAAAAMPQQPTPAPPPGDHVYQMLMLADKDRNESHWTDSTEMAMQAIKTAESLPGPGSELGRAYLLIAKNEYSQGDVPKAQAMLDKAVSAVSEKAGASSIELAMILVQTAISAEVMNDYQRAEQNLRRAIKIRETANGPSDPELSNDLTILANLCRLRGRNREAIELYQQAISNRETVNHDDLGLISPLEQLGMMYQNAGRNHEAEGTFLRFLQLMEGHSGLNNPALLDPLSKLIGLYHAMGNTDGEKQMRDRLQAIQTRAAK